MNAPGTVRTLVADPPWSFGDRLPGRGRGAERNYAVLEQTDIERYIDEWSLFGRLTGVSNDLPIRSLLAPDCRLFLWRVSSQVEEAYRVVRAWSFKPKTEIIWIKTTSARGYPSVDFSFQEPEKAPRDGAEPEKAPRDGARVHFGMGRTLRASHETCVVASRGRPEVLSRSVRSVLAAPYAGHSAKPEAFADLVERLSPGPYLELFARRRRPGWTCVGNKLEAEVSR